jgi:hypothetical protein
MHFFLYLSKKLLHESIYFNSFETSCFFLIFLYFPFCINILAIKFYNKKNKLIKNSKKNFYYIIKDSIVFKANINSLKNLIMSVSFFKYKNIQNFCIKTNNNFIYIISALNEQFSIISPNSYSILHGKKMFGGGKINILSNNLIYSRGYNSILLGIFSIFPYFFFKSIKIFKGINFITYVKINFILMILKTKPRNLKIFEINFSNLHKSFVISQICNITVKENSVNLLDILVLNNEILIANYENNSIKTWKIKFDLYKKIKKFQPCGFLNSFNNSILSFLYWGGTFRNYLFTGEINYRIMIWNELLIPILKINNIGFFLLDSKFSVQISGFILIFKKIYKKIQNKKTTIYNKRLFQTTIKFYSNWDPLKSTFRFIFDRIYYLGIIKKLNKRLNFKDIIYNFDNINKNSIFYQFMSILTINILENIKKKMIDLSSLYFLYRLLIEKFWNLFIFKLNLSFLIIKKELLCQFWKIGKSRKISLNEIEVEQWLSKNKKKSFVFKTCTICKRISKLKFNFKKKINICEFSHSLGNKLLLFPIQEKFNYFVNYKININRETFILIDQSFKNFLKKNLKNFINQKEFIWCWTNQGICNFSITLKS